MDSHDGRGQLVVIAPTMILFNKLGSHPDRVRVWVIVSPDVEGVIEVDFALPSSSQPTSKTGLPLLI